MAHGPANHNTLSVSSMKKILRNPNIIKNLQYVLFEEDPTADDLSTISLRLDALKEQRVAYNDVSKTS